MNNESLAWEITPSEKREQIRKIISRIWLLIIGFIIASYLYFVSSFTSDLLRYGIKYSLFMIVGMAIGMTIFLWLFFFLGKYIPYSSRTYSLDSAGITISKNRKKKYYSWNEFESFYVYLTVPKKVNQSPQDELREQLIQAEQDIEGQIYYLKKKPLGYFHIFYKSFVVIYSKPANSVAVTKFLNTRLQQSQRKVSDELGLISYEFS